MPSSQDLVPTGQGYGQRQENVALMRQADIPLGTSPSAPPTPVGRAPAPNPVLRGRPAPDGGFSPANLLLDHSPADFPFIQQSQPAVAGPTEADAPMTALAASAQSDFARAVLARLTSRR